jgi:hypothetical protein
LGGDRDNGYVGTTIMLDQEYEMTHRDEVMGVADMGLSAHTETNEVKLF